MMTRFAQMRPIVSKGGPRSSTLIRSNRLRVVSRENSIATEFSTEIYFSNPRWNWTFSSSRLEHWRFISVVTALHKDFPSPWSVNGKSRWCFLKALELRPAMNTESPSTSEFSTAPRIRSPASIPRVAGVIRRKKVNFILRENEVVVRSDPKIRKSFSFLLKVIKFNYKKPHQKPNIKFYIR